MKKPFALVIFITLLAPVCGCATVTSRSFPGYDSHVVWTALTAVAQSPSYDDLEPAMRWIVDENQAWADESTGRIEIFRRVHRMEGKRITHQHRNERTWRFQVVFHDGNTPSATFTARGMSIPTQVLDEANRYFADVRELLRGVDSMMPEAIPPLSAPSPTPVDPESIPASQPATQPDKTLEEILDPGGS